MKKLLVCVATVAVGYVKCDKVKSAVDLIVSKVLALKEKVCQG